MRKVCSCCKIEKPLDKFFRDKNNKTDGRYSICKECKTKKIFEWRDKNRDYYNQTIREYQALHKDQRRNCDYQRKYGCSLKEFNEIFEKQDFKCWICKKSNISTKRHFALDHDHKTGKHRGILCYGCNRALHTLEKDGLLQRAFAYLETFNK